MNIKIRLSLQFTLIVTGVLLFFSLLVYYFSYTNQLAKFRQNLLDTARNTATLLINVAEVDSSLLNKIRQSTISWEQEELVLTDSAFNMIYGNNIKYLSNSKVLENSSGHYVKFFSEGNRDGVCYRHNFNNKTYFIFTMAYDKSRVESLEELRKILFWSILFSIWLSVFLSYIFAKRAIKPITEIIKSVKEINSLKLNSRLDEGDRKDEIEELAITFNEMLSDLEIAFRNQEDFVSNASHELRTPLTVMIGETDYILSHDRNPEEYLKYVNELHSDLKKMNGLLNNLLELAQISRNKPVAFSKVRIDEIVFTSIYEVKAKFPGRKIIPKIQYPDLGNDLLVNGNEGLLRIAFQNIIDNAVKFSNEDVLIEFFISDANINVVITDYGFGIPEDELNIIGQPFRRGTNVKFIGGFGIGFSLVSRILELHNAILEIKSKVNEGTSIGINFIRLNPQ
jgi:signal transduction histidine kinase